MYSYQLFLGEFAHNYADLCHIFHVQEMSIFASAALRTGTARVLDLFAVSGITHRIAVFRSLETSMHFMPFLL